MTEDTDKVFMDFDAVLREAESRPIDFRVGGRVWTADLGVNAGRMLKWFRQGNRVEAIPVLMEALLGDKQYTEFEDAMVDANYDLAGLEKIILWLAEQMGSGDSGN